MSEYQRITSYLYEYNNGIRGENTGFAKVEVRDQQLKISFRLHSQKPILPLELYFYYYNHGKMFGIPWDTINPTSNHYEYKETFQLSDILKDSEELSKMDGLLFLHDDHSFYGSQWKDTPIQLRVFEKKSKNPPQLEEYMEAVSLHQQPVAKQDPQEKEIPEPIVVAPVNLADRPADKQEQPNDLEEKVSEIPEIKKEMPKEESSTDQAETSPAYPQITPLPTPDYSSALKLRIDDLSEFPFLPDTLPGNGFLRLQVQNYGYLFLGEKKLTDCHYIGVPGIFTNQRNFVAHLFGFPEFIPVPYQEQNTGSFGYWIMTVDH